MEKLRFLRDADEQHEDQQDPDASLARDPSTWFAQQLGEEWEADEPGIYRYVGPKTQSPAEVRSIPAAED